MILSHKYLALCLTLALLLGCGDGNNETIERETAPDGETEVPAAEEDDSSAAEGQEILDSVGTLEGLGAKLKRDKTGNVVVADLRGIDVGDTGTAMAEVGKIATLEQLDVRGCAVSNDELACAAKLSKLKALRMLGKNEKGGRGTVDDEGMLYLADLTRLKALALDYLSVSKEGLAKLAKLENLQELYMTATEVDDDALAVLEQFPKLKKLRIGKTAITDDGLAHLKGHAALEKLDISECKEISDDAVAHVSQMKSLVDLNLWRVPITDAGVAHLAGMTEMESLNLDDTDLTDEGLKHLKGMSKLTFLHVGTTKITDAGVEHLAALSTLKDLNVSRTKMTADGFAELQKKLPNTKIVTVHPDDK